MPGTTHPRRSFDDDEGVGVGRVGGDREGRGSAGPSGSAGTRSDRSPWRGGTTGESGGFGNGAVHAARSAAFRKKRGATHPGDWGTRCASRVGETAEALHRLSWIASRKGRDRGSGRIGSPVRTDARRVKRCFGSERDQETVHAAWWSGPRLSGFRPEIAQATTGRRWWT
jgi:hypothetical protein